MHSQHPRLLHPPFCTCTCPSSHKTYHTAGCKPDFDNDMWLCGLMPTVSGHCFPPAGAQRCLCAAGMSCFCHVPRRPAGQLFSSRAPHCSAAAGPWAVRYMRHRAAQVQSTPLCSRSCAPHSPLMHRARPAQPLTKLRSRHHRATAEEGPPSPSPAATSPASHSPDPLPCTAPLCHAGSRRSG